MSVDFRVFYGYGYEISNEKAFNLSPEKYDELIDSDYTQFLDGYSDERKCFFGITITTIPGCEMYEVKDIDSINEEDYNNMILEYRNIFEEWPDKPHHYIGFAVM